MEHPAKEEPHQGAADLRTIVVVLVNAPLGARHARERFHVGRGRPYRRIWFS